MEHKYLFINNKKNLIVEFNEYKYLNEIYNNEFNLIDLNYHDYYGKLNENKLPLELNKSFLKFTSEVEPVKLLNFVADAYDAFRNEWNLENRFKIKSLVGYIDFEQIYQNHLEQISNIYIEQYLSNNLNFHKINNKYDFYENFKKFILNINIPFTKVAFLLSHMTPVHVSGLVLDFVYLNNTEQDSRKLKNESFYEKMIEKAAKYGFHLEMNTPWRLVFNPHSVPAQHFLKKNNLGLNSPLEDCYNLIINQYNNIIIDYLNYLNNLIVIFNNTYNIYSKYNSNCSNLITYSKALNIQSLKSTDSNFQFDIFQILEKEFFSFNEKSFSNEFKSIQSLNDLNLITEFINNNIKFYI